jgi:hypothetical protein
MSGPELDREPRQLVALTICGRLVGAVGILIVVVLLPATFLVVAGTLDLIDSPGWAGDNTSTFAFFLLVVPVGLALAAIHFIVGGLMIARKLWPLVATVLLAAAVVTVFPIGLRIAWPFLSLTGLYVVSLVLVLRHLHEFE